jgi:hypothetical protein
MAIDQTDPMIVAPGTAAQTAAQADSEHVDAALSSEGLPAPTSGRRMSLTGTVRRVSGIVSLVGRSATWVVARVPGTMDATRAGAAETTTALQTLPDPTLRSLAASSVALGAGFYLAGAPRVVVAAGVVPAMILGAAIVLRPTEPLVPAEAD